MKNIITKISISIFLLAIVFGFGTVGNANAWNRNTWYCNTYSDNNVANTVSAFYVQPCVDIGSNTSFVYAKTVWTDKYDDPIWHSSLYCTPIIWLYYDSGYTEAQLNTFSCPDPKGASSAQWGNRQYYHSGYTYYNQTYTFYTSAVGWSDGGYWDSPLIH